METNNYLILSVQTEVRKHDTPYRYIPKIVIKRPKLSMILAMGWYSVRS